MGFHSDKQRKGFFANRNSKGDRQPAMKEKEPEPTFKIVKVKGQAFVQRTIVTKKAKIVQRRPI